MENKTELILHVGYPKTGTTYFQQQFFKLLGAKVNYISDYESGLRDICFYPSYQINFNKLKSNLNLLSNKLNIISYEGLVGNWRHGQNNLDSIILGIKELFDNIKILIIVRNQVDLVRSLYSQYIQEGGTLNINSFLRLTPPNNIYFNFDFLDFSKLINHFETIFGHDNLVVLPYELMKTDKDSFFKILAEKTGYHYLYTDYPKESFKINKSISFGKLRTMRVLNNFLYSSINNSCIVPPKKFNSHKLRMYFQYGNNRILEILSSKHDIINFDLKKSIYNRYNDTNQNLKNKFSMDYNIDISRMGYFNDYI